MISCMGGWCNSRSKCDHYHAEVISDDLIVERLCGEEEEPEICGKESASTEWKTGSIGLAKCSLTAVPFINSGTSLT